MHACKVASKSSQYPAGDTRFPDRNVAISSMRSAYCNDQPSARFDLCAPSITRDKTLLQHQRSQHRLR